MYHQNIKELLGSSGEIIGQFSARIASTNLSMYFGASFLRDFSIMDFLVQISS
jgi:hypothetical protein